MLAKYDLVLEEQRREKQAERRIQGRSLMITLLIAFLLGLIVFLIKISQMNPPLGYEGGGGGGSQGVLLEGPAEGQIAEMTKQEQPQPQVQEPVPVTPEQRQQEEASTESTNGDVEVEKKKTTPEHRPVVENHPVVTHETRTEPKKEEPKLDPNNIFKPSGGGGGGGTSSGGGGGGTGTGIGSGTGSGTGPGSGSGSGGGSGSGHGPGNGPGFELAGRGAKYIPDPKPDFEVEGKVTVEVVVDREGNVVSARAGIPKTTINNIALFNLLEREVKKAKFTPKEDAPEQQYGKVIYEYRRH